MRILVTILVGAVADLPARILTAFLDALVIPGIVVFFKSRQSS